MKPLIRPTVFYSGDRKDRRMTSDALPESYVVVPAANTRAKQYEAIIHLQDRVAELEAALAKIANWTTSVQHAEGVARRALALKGDEAK